MAAFFSSNCLRLKTALAYVVTLTFHLISIRLDNVLHSSSSVEFELPLIFIQKAHLVFLSLYKSYFNLMALLGERRLSSSAAFGNKHLRAASTKIFKMLWLQKKTTKEYFACHFCPYSYLNQSYQ